MVGGESQLVVEVQFVDFDDHAVGVKGVLIAVVFFPVVAVVDDVVNGGEDAQLVGGGEEAQFCQEVDACFVCGELVRTQKVVSIFVYGVGDLVKDGGEWSACDFPGVLETECTCHGVARVGEGSQSLFLSFVVEPFKVGASHNHFAAQFYFVDSPLGEGCAQWYGSYGSDVGCDVFSGLSVAAGGAAYQEVVFVDEGDAGTIQFGFHGVVPVCVGWEEGSDTPVEFTEVFGVVGVI